MILETQIKKYQNWHYKNTFFLLLSVLLFYFISDSYFVRNIVEFFRDLGQAGLFVIGMFFVLTFTIAPASLILYDSLEVFPLWEVAIIAGLGGLFGDFIIFRFFKDKIFSELQPIFEYLSERAHVTRIFKSPFFIWLAPVIGAVIIASPFPDELGVSLMGLARLKTWQFLTIAGILDILGIYLVLSIAQLIVE